MALRSRFLGTKLASKRLDLIFGGDIVVCDCCPALRYLAHGCRVGEDCYGFLDRFEVVRAGITATGRPFRVTVTRSWVVTISSTTSDSLALAVESGMTFDMTIIIVYVADRNSPLGRTFGSVHPPRSPSMEHERAFC